MLSCGNLGFQGSVFTMFDHADRLVVDQHLDVIAAEQQVCLAMGRNSEIVSLPHKRRIRGIRFILARTRARNRNQRNEQHQNQQACTAQRQHNLALVGKEFVHLGNAASRSRRYLTPRSAFRLTANIAGCFRKCVLSLPDCLGKGILTGSNGLTERKGNAFLRFPRFSGCLFDGILFEWSA